jgi:hypothetical protein
MAEMQPFNRLVGRQLVYLAPYGEPEPNINGTPGANWVRLGATDGDQVAASAGDLTLHYDDDHQGPVKAHLPQEDLTFTWRLVNMSLEMFARATSNVGRIVSTTMNGANVKRLPLKRGKTPTEYALLFKGEADSPYGNLPGQYYAPRVLLHKPFTRTRNKTNSDGIDCTATALEDDNQTEDNRLGWLTVQES